MDRPIDLDGTEHTPLHLKVTIRLVLLVYWNVRRSVSFIFQFCLTQSILCLNIPQYNWRLSTHQVVVRCCWTSRSQLPFTSPTTSPSSSTELHRISGHARLASTFYIFITAIPSGELSTVSEEVFPASVDVNLQLDLQCPPIFRAYFQIRRVLRSEGSTPVYTWVCILHEAPT